MTRHDTSRAGRRPASEKPSAAAEVAQMQRAALSRTTSAMVHATGELQESVARRTGLLQKEAAHQLRMATNPAELMAVQTALLMAGWQHSIQCTTDVANAWFAIGTAGALPKDRKTPLN
jgi:hypothetical protein